MKTRETSSTRYRGRFAPSPTGPLHFGSLVAAVGSYLQARVRHGEWLVRIEDIDEPRNVPGAADDILASLERLGFEWDGDIRWQSRMLDAYHEALGNLIDAGHCFTCLCTRSKLRQTAIHGPDGFIYPGTCRANTVTDLTRGAIRVRVCDSEITFDDALQGNCTQHLERDVGDFVVRRGDGLFAYQLAVVVDDAQQGITEVVRGTDLLGSTTRQIYLQRLLDLPTPGYLHLPVVVNSQGQKLSKQTGAAALDLRRPGMELFHALQFLGQQPPDELMHADTADIWHWAIHHWDITRIPAVTSQAMGAPLDAKAG